LLRRHGAGAGEFVRRTTSMAEFAAKFKRLENPVRLAA
jgi:hypothetical protein